MMNYGLASPTRKRPDRQLAAPERTFARQIRPEASRRRQPDRSVPPTARMRRWSAVGVAGGFTGPRLPP